MDELPSAQFRKVYATLKSPVVVTVNGHAIGTYQPIMSMIDVRAIEATRPGEPRAPTATISGPAVTRNPYREFRPVPKHK